MKTIDTLVDDIYGVIAGGSPPATSNNKVDISYDKWFNPRDRTREEKVLYFSEVGDPCPRRLWYKYNTPTIGVKPDGRALLKFFYGDMLEELVLNVAEDAGHKVEKKQERAIYEIGDGWIVRGRIDAIIDNVCVDVKSVTKFSEVKFANGLKDYYPIEVNKTLFKLQAESSAEIAGLEAPDVLKRLDPVPASKTSKNSKLCTSCSYCNFKKECWPEMRTFLYSSGPEFLVNVVDTPRVMEITNNV